MATMKLEIFFDVVSPYSYLLFTALRRYRALPSWRAVEFVYRPVMLGSIMKGSGNQPPGMLPARGAYMQTDLERCTRASGVPYSFPESFPVLTLKPNRVLCALALDGTTEQFEAVAAELFGRYWGRGLDVVEDESLVEACVAAGLSKNDAGRLLARSTDPEVKDLLKANTNDGLERGMFGAPTCYASKPGADEPDMFFGSDRVEEIAAYFNLPYHGRHGRSAAAKL